MTSYGSINVQNNNESEPLIRDETDNSEDTQFILESSPISLYQSLTFAWLAPLLTRGNAKEQLDPEDLHLLPLPASCSTKHVTDAFETLWEKEVERCSKSEEKGIFGLTSKRYKKPSLAWTLARAYGKAYLKAGFLKLIHDISIFVGPIVLHGLIQFLRDPSKELKEGFFLTASVTISQLLMSFCLRHYFFGCYLTGLRMRTAVVTAVYKKALVLSSSERQSRSAGQIVNLMTIDAQRIQDLTTYGHAVWYSLLQISVAMYFLWQQLGPSCLGGVAVIFIMVPVNRYVAGWMATLQARLMKARDERVEINSEVLGSMKVIKFQNWEESFQRRILCLRNAELRHLYVYAVGRAITVMLWSAVPLGVALATFTAYTLSGNDLDVATALTSLALFDILRFPLFMLPQVVNNLVEAGVSFHRVQDFLICETHTSVGEGRIAEDVGIHVDSASFVYDNKKPKTELGVDERESNESILAKKLGDQKWEIMLLKSQLEDAEDKLRELSEKDLTTFNEKDNYVEDEKTIPAVIDDLDGDENQSGSLLSLRRVNMKCQRGELIAVVGCVGSGKSTFINSLLGEVRAVSGSVSVRGRLSFFPQTPFIMNDTLKNNVIFGHQGEEVDEDKYKRAISACALDHDITLLSDGDMTEIGEKGITLSGGQKARVSLARAFYHDADIYLLDDPIAAVDAHVGKHIFQKCIVDELLYRKNSPAGTKEGAVILVTNAIQYLSNPAVDKIVVLDNGCIAEVGTYQELSESPKSLFSAFLSVMAETGMALSEEDSLIPTDVEVHEENSSIGSGEEIYEKESTFISENQAPSPSSKAEKRRNASIETMIRRSSSISPKKDDKVSTVPLMTSELQEREKGHVGLDVYRRWIKAGGGMVVAILILLGYAADQALSVTSKWWLTYWSQNTGGDKFEFLRVYALINLMSLIAIFMRVIAIVLIGLKASRILYEEVLDTVLRAPMSFFDTTPLGRIINRFSKDIYTIDESLVSTMRSFLATISNVIGVVIVISSVTPFFTLGLIPMIIFYLRQQMYFTRTYRELKRLDSVSRSPLYALLSETLDGVPTIRAFDAEPALLRRMTSLLDNQQNAYFLTCTAQCWLAVRLELIGTLIIFSACLCAVLEHPRQAGNEAFAGLAGLSISFALSVTQSLNWSVRMGSDLEASMVSVERIRQYSKLPTEPPHHMPNDEGLGRWPSIGIIEFSSVQMRYRAGLPLVLKNLDLTIPAMSKVGVVGRTGAGKSTLMVSLLRLIELESGSISIDGIDISHVGLSILRSKIAVIPQDPVLFSGTVRTNLDPFEEHEDGRLNEVLERVGLKFERVPSSNSLTSLGISKTSQARMSLLDNVSEGGTNFSVGQRQLLVIARALLSRTKIVIMDEATASVDADTDARIQRVMRTEFKNSTCITVAHRINTIMDSDYILVMDDGRVAEFDRPKELISKKGLFKDLIDAWEEEN